ncbi:MAG TPA: 3-deoxy-7-phosphoheptulonate synthase [Terriglobia bacterium]|nr:3-deoxy-7-phosphoheptulonate synthase [Terriglobia bacterium]
MCAGRALQRHSPIATTVAEPPYRLASRKAGQPTTVVRVAGVAIGGDHLVVIAGPCSVESRQQISETAHRVKAAGAHMLRGGAYKPRTSPYEFQGLGRQALAWLAEARDASGLPIVTEVLSPEEVELVAEHADLLQVGARNMQNYALLRRLATCPKPVLLKRGPSATLHEWLLAAEYLLSGGNPNVVLCERGIRTFETAMRNTLDLGGVALVKELSHLPVLVDPSHGTGQRRLVAPASRAAAAIGADGLMIEVHPRPEHALSDGAQSLDVPQFAALMNDLRSFSIRACA